MSPRKKKNFKEDDLSLNSLGSSLDKNSDKESEGKRIKKLIQKKSNQVSMIYEMQNETDIVEKPLLKEEMGSRKDSMLKDYKFMKSE